MPLEPATQQAKLSSESGTSSDKGPPKPESSVFSAPQISLPKGGGAIAGIGEKFQANSATGTGQLTIPLPTSAARSGFGPQLALTYDSGAGNGIFAMGGTVPLSSISLKTEKGLPKFRRREKEECDVYILSGAEDLVPAFKQDDFGQWVEDELDLDGYQVKRYRPRIEGLFARIERWTRRRDGDQHWRSISKDNILTVYGRDERSRIVDPKNQHRVFSWLISESYDDKGNAIAYEYKAEDRSGVDAGRPSEANRGAITNRYPKRILYGNRVPLLTDERLPGRRASHLSARDLDEARWMFEIVFDYGDQGYCVEPDRDGREWVHCACETRPEHVWLVRQDPFSRYRSRFELRTYRLCHRVLIFHHFPEELGTEDCLVRSVEFGYHQKPTGSLLTTITQSGYVRHHDGRYLRKSMPPVELEYSPSPLETDSYLDLKAEEVDPLSLENLPAGINDANYKWVDLDGEGIAGVLTEQGTGWYYKPNNGNGHFGRTELVRSKPSLASLSRGQQQLLDISGGGTLNLVEFNSSAPGFYNRTFSEGWGSFHAFQTLPVLDWKNPNLRFVDVTGDGIADILITEDDAFLWHESLLEEGFGRAIRVSIPADESEGPHLIFSDGIQSIYLADMSGDGLTDLVRIRRGEVCFFPNQGYGVFGPKIVMENAPLFEDEDLFEQSRVRLTDVDGSGCADIVYLGVKGIAVYLNQSGNRWSEARIFSQFSPVTPETALSVVDLLGRGTSCLLWSSPLPGDQGRQLRYLDLMGGVKPHLLVHVRNNLGAETHIEYATSTDFYLADKASGQPWLTHLPFPVHVVKRIETYDYVGRNRFVTSYSYHEGFFDSQEREFRGFGRVEQLDWEQIRALEVRNSFPLGDNVDPASSVPPVLTKTWFHTGVFLGSGRVSRHMAHQYYREPTLDSIEQMAMMLDDTILPPHLTPEEAREACRALKGSILRQEIYALDGTEESALPYTVTESNSTIRVVQPRLANLHGVFFSHPRESLTFHYERKLYPVDGERRADPRVAHNLTLKVDRFGNVLESVSVGYGRRFPDPSPLLTEEDHEKQRQTLLTLNENTFTNSIDGLHAYRAPVPSETRNYELIGIRPARQQTGITNLFRFAEMRGKIEQVRDKRYELPYEDIDRAGADGTSPYRRLISSSRNYYRADSLDGLLPLGVTGSLALAGESYNLAFTPGLLDQIYRKEKGTEELIADLSHVLSQTGKYVDLDGDSKWWLPSGRIFYAPHACEPSEEIRIAERHFFEPRRFEDPFGHTTHVAYDRHDLFAVEVRDGVGNIARSEIDYRVLAPFRTTDANRNRSEVAFDALGQVVGIAQMGKVGEHVGDSLDGFEADLNEAEILEHLAHPFEAPDLILKLATTRLVYDLYAYARTRDSITPQPAVVYRLSREQHAAELRHGHVSKIQHAFSYSDGFGREIQKKVQAEPGRLEEGRPECERRWVGTGWVIYNNKGKSIRQYEPFFTRLHLFEFANKVGVSSTQFYDPVQRVVATLHPNRTYDKVVFDPWRQETWDVNDTVLQQNPAEDPDVGDYFARLAQSEYRPTWYEQRRDGELGREEQQAARKAAVHAGTPATSYADNLGRVFLTVAHNRREQDSEPIDEFYTSRVEIDIENNQRIVEDALGRPVMRYDYDLLHTRIRSVSVDAGTRWILNDAAGQPMLSFDSRGHRFRREYDALHRPTNFYVRKDHGPEILAEQIIYGEGQTEDFARNLRNKPYRQYDGAGLVTNDRYDFKGNLLKSTRQLIENHRGDVDWSQPHELAEIGYAIETSYDALNRVIRLETPDRSVARAEYNESNLLHALSVRLRGVANWTPFIHEIGYNAKGQRERVHYANGAHTRYTHDPLTFRMVHLVTVRGEDHDRLQALSYTYDPVGNITSIRDQAQETIYFENSVISPTTDYTYDATYRLISAEGREHAVNRVKPHRDEGEIPRAHHPLPCDGRALDRYREQYEFDSVGNLLRLLHSAKQGSWARHYSYDDSRAPSNNRLSSTRIGDERES